MGVNNAYESLSDKFAAWIRKPVQKIFFVLFFGKYSFQAFQL